jgi:UDP-glucose 4-epimerase
MEMLHAKQNNILVNLATGEGHSVMDVIHKTREISQKEIPFEITGRRAGDPATVIAASKKAQKVLDWSPKYSDLDSLIRSTWEVYK